MRRRIPWLLLALLLACLAATELRAADSVGVLIVEQGLVKVRRGTAEQVYPASALQIPVNVGDELQSAKNTRARVVMRDNQDSINLYSSTFFRVEDVRPARSSFALSIGKAIFVAARRLSSQVFEVRTPTATIGVKGTEFVLGTDGINKTFLLTVSGVVSMVSTDFPGREVLVRQDQASTSVRGSPPTPPIVVTPETRESIKSEDSLKTMINVVPQAPPPPAGGGGTTPNSGGSPRTTETSTATSVADSAQQAGQIVNSATDTTTTSAAAQLQISIQRGATGGTTGGGSGVGITITR